jgi:hypothetical protein
VSRKGIRYDYEENEQCGHRELYRDLFEFRRYMGEFEGV